MAKMAGAIDIGTNSVKITVARREGDGSLTILADRTAITRLGKNVDADGRLDPTAVQKTLDALTDFAREARLLGAETIAAVGTSALRDAANGAAFVAKATEILGGTVEVISGDREAELVWASASRDSQILAAVRERYPQEDVTLIATDSGGGSTEVIIGTATGVTFRDSLQLGAVRLTERTAPSDPYTVDDLARAIAICDEAIKHVPVPSGASVVIASGGTATNLGAIAKGNFDSDSLHAFRLTTGEVKSQVLRLAALPLAERRNVPGLEPDRADVIVSGALIQARLVSHLKTEYLLVSLRGLRYGLLYTLV